MAIRYVRSYRTISYDAPMQRFTTEFILSIRMTNEVNFDRTHIHKPYGLGGLGLFQLMAVGAVLTGFEACIWRTDCVTYRLAQKIIGHGCFGEYLNRIGREATVLCHHHLNGTPLGTHWRTVLRGNPSVEFWSVRSDQIRRNLSPPALIASMVTPLCGRGLSSKAGWCFRLLINRSTSGHLGMHLSRGVRQGGAPSDC